MANEITITASLQVANGAYQDQQYSRISVDQNTVGAAGGTQSIPTSEVTLDAGDVATAGYLFLQNLDAVNFVEWGHDSTTNKCGKLKPGEVALFRASGAIKLIADTATVQIRYLLLND